MDRFGLRVIVSGLAEAKERLEVYHRVRAFTDNPHEFLALYGPETMAFTEELVQAKDLLPEVTVSPEAEQMALDLVNTLQIASSRAEIVTLEAARAYAAAAGRAEATVEDVSAVAPMALRQRRSQFMVDYFEESEKEEEEIKRENYLRRERRFGSYCRSVTLPGGLEADKAEAAARVAAARLAQGTDGHETVQISSDMPSLSPRDRPVRPSSRWELDLSDDLADDDDELIEIVTSEPDSDNDWELVL